MRSVVANEKDALNILFEAAQHESHTHSLEPVHENDVNSSHASYSENTNASVSTSTVWNGSPNDTAQQGDGNTEKSQKEVLRVWNAYRFVAMGWLSAEEALNLVDAFFKNMSPLSPVLDDFYADHTNHYQLVTREPFLCCMILAISSRYHALPSPGGISRGYMLHQRLWDHCQHLLLRLIMGQEKNSKARIRTLGSIEALLLLVEWHPRSLHVPPVGDGWDSDVLLTVRNDRDESSVNVDGPSRSRWKEDVIKPAKRSDQMSWMVLGCASSLMMEVALPSGDEDTAIPGAEGYGKRLQTRRLPIIRLVCLFQEQLSSRLGNRSMMPEGLSHIISPMKSASRTGDHSDDDWDVLMSAWEELTKLERSISHTMFPSWFQNTIAETLLVEYSSIKIHANSLGLQAIVERAIASGGDGVPYEHIDMNLADYACIQAVLDASLEILKVAIRLAESESLKFAPARLFLRITTASVFLLKALGLGASMSRLQDSLSLLSRVISALKTCKPDDVHLGARYATLLEAHTTRLQERFIPAVRPSFIDHAPSAVTATGDGIANAVADWQVELSTTIQNLDATVLAGADDSWLSLPIELSLQPFVLGDSSNPEWLHPNSLDFIWSTNL
ncbi:hypothetical protein LQW54_012408 [Pestalotiopsis sp. IQ-011]